MNTYLFSVLPEHSVIGAPKNFLIVPGCVLVYGCLAYYLLLIRVFHTSVKLAVNVWKT